MKKVLILSYFYPPGNFAGCYRIQAWAEELALNGYEPIVVTRHWDKNCTDYTAISTKQNRTQTKENGVTIYRLPYRGTWRDRLVASNLNLFGLEKLLSFINLIVSLYILRLNPAYPLYIQAKKIIATEPAIQIVLTSGRPFYQFQFLHLLKKQFNHLICIGDYRDPWNTNTNIDQSLKRKFFRLLERPIEQKTTHSFSFITTCSTGFKENIQSLISCPPIHVITNGFKNFHAITESLSINNKFEIAFIGSLYANQQIETFLYPLIISPYAKNIKLLFYGLDNQSEQKRRILSLTNNSNLEVVFAPWLEKEELIKHVVYHDAFLLCGLKSQKGRHTAKFFDYLSFQKNIILCPSDDDVLTAEINRLAIGITLNDEEDVKNWLHQLHQKNYKWEYNGHTDLISIFTYYNQVKKLIDHIES